MFRSLNVWLKWLVVFQKTRSSQGAELNKYACYVLCLGLNSTHLIHLTTAFSRSISVMMIEIRNRTNSENVKTREHDSIIYSIVAAVSPFNVGHPAVNLTHRPLCNSKLSTFVNGLFQSHLCSAKCSPRASLALSHDIKRLVLSIRLDQSKYELLWSSWCQWGIKSGPCVACQQVREVYIYVLDLNSCDWLTSRLALFQYPVNNSRLKR